MTHFASDENGHITDVERDFLENRFEGFGMFISAATLVVQGGKAFTGQPEAIDDSDLDSLKEVVKIAHKQGAKAILQLHHGGYRAIPTLNPNQEIFAPSNHENGAKELTDEQIQEIILGFSNATKLAIKAGFDGVEIHGANIYLIQQFFSGATNKREDKWGGSVEKRLSFPIAVVEAVTNAVKDDGNPEFIVGYRLSPEEPDEDGITMDQTLVLVEELSVKPIQYIHISLQDIHSKPHRSKTPDISRVNQISKIIDGKLALIAVGGIFTGQDVQKALDNQNLDFVGIGKSVLLNPNLAKLIKEQKDDEIEHVFDKENSDKYRLPEIVKGFFK